MDFKTVRHMQFAGKRVLLRADYNVPIKDGKVVDDYRLVRTLPTIHHIREQGAKQIIFATHLGRPKGKVVEELRVDPIAERLAQFLSYPVKKINSLDNIPDDHLVMIENVAIRSRRNRK